MAARKSSSTKKSPAVAPVAKKVEAPTPMKAVSMAPVVNGPYSAAAIVNFVSQNAGLIFIGLSIFLVGFMAGSMWTENSLLKSQLKANAVAQAPAAQQGQQAPQPSPTPLSDDDWKTVQDTPAGVIGDPNAKVTMVEFTDYQCPFCGQFYKNSYADLKKTYIDTGKMKLVLRDQPLPFHPNSRIGALAARCAADQGLFGAKTKNFEYMHDALFGNQDQWVNLGKDDAIKKFGDYATAGGMDGNTLMDCVKTEKFGKAVDADIALANKVGANGTPTFFVNKEMVVGAQPTDVFKTTIDKYLAQ